MFANDHLTNNMKRALFFIFLFSAVTVTAQAPRGVYFAAGLNQSSLQSDDLLATSALGWRVGVNANFGYHETYNYQIEIAFNQSTFDLLTIDAGTFEPSGKSKYKMESFEVGAYFNYYILKPQEDAFFLGLQAGPMVAFGNSLVPKSGQDTSGELYLPYQLNEDSFRLSMPKMTLNVGVGLTGGYNNIRFDLRYTKGFTNLLSDVETSNSYDESGQYIGPALEAKVDVVSLALSYNLARLFGFQ